MNIKAGKSKNAPPLLVLLGSSRSSTYLYVNYMLTATESRKVEDKLVLSIRRQSLSMARAALVKSFQHVQNGKPTFLQGSDDIKRIVQSTEVIKLETVESMRRIWAMADIQAAFWRLPWQHPADPEISVQSELAFMLANVKQIFTQSRVCTSTLSLRFVHELFTPGSGQLVQLKQCAVVQPRDSNAMPADSRHRSGALVYSVDLCVLRTRFLADELDFFRNALKQFGSQLGRACVFVFFTNVVQFAIDIERENLPYSGLAGYQGPPCATTMFRFVEKRFVDAVPPAIVLHLALPKMNSRFDFVERTAPLLEQWTTRFVAFQEAIPTNTQRVVRRHTATVDGVEVERLPGNLPTLNLSNRGLSIMHLMDVPPQWQDLAHLDLSDNRLEMFPIRSLTALPLHSLVLAKNNLALVEQTISLFVNLRKLDLSNNSLSIFPRPVSALSYLRELRLGHNKLVAISTTVLASVVHLEVFDAAHNRIVSIPPEISRLDKLRLLQLSNNCIATLPIELGRCTSLRMLGLADNALVEPPQCLAQLTMLESLDLERNKLACAISRSPLVGLTQLTLLALAGNDGITDVAPAVLKKAKGDARDLLRHLERNVAGGTVSTRRARLVVLGNSGAGKTALIRTLVRNEPVKEAILPVGASGDVAPLVNSAGAPIGAVGAVGMGGLMAVDNSGGPNSAIEGIGSAGVPGAGPQEIGSSARLMRLSRGGAAIADVETAEWKLEIDGHGTVVYNVWDVPDNDLYRATMGACLPAKSLVMIVWDLRTPLHEALDFWLSQVRSLAPHSTCVLVTTHADDPQCDKRMQDRTWEMLERRYLVHYSEQVHAYHTVSCVTMGGIAELRTALAQLAPSTAAPDDESSSTLEHFGALLREKRSRQRPVLRQTEVLQPAAAALKSEKSLFPALRIVSDCTDMIFLDVIDSAPLTVASGSIEPLVVLDPRWLMEQASLFLNRGIAVDEHGILRHSVLFTHKVWAELRSVVRNAVLGSMYDAEALVALPPLARWPSPYESVGAFTDAVFTESDALASRSIVVNRLARAAPALTFLWPATLGAATSGAGGEPIVELRRIVKMQFVPSALMPRLVSCLAAFAIVEVVWRGGALVRGRNNARALVAIDERRSVLLISVRAVSPGRLVNLVTQTAKSLLSSWYNVPHSIHVVCIHCIAGLATVYAKSDSLPEHVTATEDPLVLEAAWRASPTAFRLSNMLTDVDVGEVLMCGNEGVPIDAMIPDLTLNAVRADRIDPASIEIGAVLGHGAYGEVYSGIYNGVRVAVKELRDSQGADVDQFGDQTAAVLSGGGGGAGAQRGGGGGGNGEDDDDYGDIVVSDEAERANRNVDAFAREVRIMARLKHPNVVRMHGFTRIGKHWLVMEFVEHGDLYTLLNGAELGDTRGADSGRSEMFDMAPLPNDDLSSSSAASSKRVQLTWLTRLRIALDIARGMAYLHSLRPAVCHRDLKSPNVFMSSLDERSAMPMAKVADFGLSSVMYTPELRQTLKSRAVENPTWLAPEVLGERSYGLPSDVYAFGIILWELFTQKHPFREFNFRFLFNQEAAVLEGKRPTFPPSCEIVYASLATRCWSQRPAERPSFERVVDDLSGIARQLAPLALMRETEQPQVEVEPDMECVTPASLAEPPQPLRGITLRVLSTGHVGDGPASPRASSVDAEDDYATVPGSSRESSVPGGAGATNSASSSSSAVSCMVLTPSKCQVLCGTSDGDIIVFNALSGDRVQRIVGAHAAPVLDIVAVAPDNLSECLVCSAAQSELLTWNLGRESRGDVLQRSGVLQIRVESSVDGDDLSERDARYSGVMLTRQQQEAGGTGMPVASNGGDEDEARAKKRFVELRSFSLGLFKEAKGRAASSTPQRLLWLDDAEFLGGNADAAADSARYVGLLRTRNASIHIWVSGGGVVQRDAWREALRRAVASVAYPRQHWRLRRLSMLPATASFGPRCLCMIDGNIWIGCDGLRIGVIDGKSGAPIYSFQIDAPLPLVLSSVRLIGLDAFDGGDVDSNVAVPISVMRPTGDGSLLLAVGDRLVSLQLSDCLPERLEQLARVASGTSRMIASGGAGAGGGAGGAANEAMAADVVVPLALSGLGAPCHYLLDSPLGEGGAAYPGGLAGQLALVLGTVEDDFASATGGLGAAGGSPGKGKAKRSFIRNAIGMVAKGSKRIDIGGDNAMARPMGGGFGGPGFNNQAGGGSPFMRHSFTDIPVSPPSLATLDGAAPGSILSIDVMMMSAPGGLRLFAVCGAARGISTWDIRGHAQAASGEVAPALQPIYSATALSVTAGHAADVVIGCAEGAHVVDRRATYLREWQNRPANVSVRAVLRVGALVWMALSTGQIAVVQ